MLFDFWSSNSLHTMELATTAQRDRSPGFAWSNKRALAIPDTPKESPLHSSTPSSSPFGRLNQFATRTTVALGSPVAPEGCSTPRAIVMPTRRPIVEHSQRSKNRLD
jgi:hypothetical protein